jgi:hypothetical protein
MHRQAHAQQDTRPAVSQLRRTHFGARVKRLRRRRSTTARHSISTNREGHDTFLACMIATSEASRTRLDVHLYEAIEAGTVRPTNPAEFIRMLEVCLGLTQRERNQLLRQLAYDILVAELGEAAALAALE